MGFPGKALLSAALAFSFTLSGCSLLGIRKGDKPLYPDPECVVQKGEKGEIHYPIVKAIVPTEGTRMGGTLVTLEGEAFTQGMMVKVGDSHCVGMTLNSSTSASCYTTSHSVGKAAVLVKLPDKRCGMLEDAYTYYPAVVISPRYKMLTTGRSFQFKGSQGREPYKFSVASGAGTIEEATGMYTAPVTAGLDIVKVVDAFGTSSEAIVRINPALQIDPQTLGLMVGNTYPFAVTGGVPPFSFRMKSGSGKVDSELGSYSTPSSEGQDVIELSDAIGNTSEATVTVHPTLSMSASAKLIAVFNQAQVSAQGGVPPLKFDIASGEGDVDPQSGLFTASSSPGTANVRVTDAFGNHLETVQININPGLVIIPPNKSILLGESVAFGASGGVPPYKFELMEPRLGKFDPKAAFFTANATPGVQVVRVSDSYGNFAEAQITITAGAITSQKIALGFGHTCAVADGAVKCWGNNRHGQLGEGTNESSLKPLQVQGLDQGAAAVVAGQYHTCALVKGAVKCWGENTHGQLGNSSKISSSIPVQVIGMDRHVQAIAAGSHHTCAVKLGSVYCWGDNRRGQLGNNSTMDAIVPMQVLGLNVGGISVSAGESHSCALIQPNNGAEQSNTNGGVKCWGYNSSGQLGNGNLQASLVPVDVLGLEENVVVLESGGFHSCALTSDGGVKCWGHNGAGQLGDRSILNRYIAVEAQGLEAGVTSIKLGYYHTCAMQNGQVRCWGYNNSGQIDSMDIRRHVRPVTISLQNPVEAIASGVLHTCALVKDTGGKAGVRCWGDNGYGQFGNRTRLSSSKPVPFVPVQ